MVRSRLLACLRSSSLGAVRSRDPWWTEGRGVNPGGTRKHGGVWDQMPGHARGALTPPRLSWSQRLPAHSRCAVLLHIEGASPWPVLFKPQEPREEPA